MASHNIIMWIVNLQAAPPGPLFTGAQDGQSGFKVEVLARFRYSAAINQPGEPC